MHTVFVGLGSNLDGPREQVLQALQALGKLPHTRMLAHSSLYRSAPVGYTEQPDFINAVAQLETELDPRALLDALLALEQECGRTREFINAPRTLDLDVLLYDALRHHEHGLTIPHPQMHLRAFVLRPLLEIAPDCVIPGIATAAAAFRQCVDQQLERVEDKAIHLTVRGELVEPLATQPEPFDKLRRVPDQKLDGANGIILK
jgi:2-amino-4-hydroxy-6-hydroxymethyldihydropteridine diphosphokinase